MPPPCVVPSVHPAKNLQFHPKPSLAHTNGSLGTRPVPASPAPAPTRLPHSPPPAPLPTLPRRVGAGGRAAQGAVRGGPPRGGRQRAHLRGAPVWGRSSGLGEGRGRRGLAEYMACVLGAKRLGSGRRYVCTRDQGALAHGLAGSLDVLTGQPCYAVDVHSNMVLSPCPSLPVGGDG